MEKAERLEKLEDLIGKPEVTQGFSSKGACLAWATQIAPLLNFDPQYHKPFVYYLQIITAPVSSYTAEPAFQNMLNQVHMAIGDLKQQLAAASNVPPGADKIFGPGAVYDFFKALNEVVSSARASLLIVDPYMDDQIFDAYLSNAKAGVAVRLLVGKYAANVKAAAAKFAAQHGIAVEVRSSKAIHDRLVFVDGDACWVLGQSIKDAAVAKPTYLAPLSPDVGAPKLAQYEQIWQQGNAI